MAKQNSTNKMARRNFLAGAAAATFTVVKPSLVRGTKANSTIEMGIIGCGSRGKWIAGLFQKHGKYKVVACADYYDYKVKEFGDKWQIDPSRRYTTLSGYKKLVASKLDAVAVESPPYCHPDHAEAAVDAGKHVYLAKPIATDVPGCLRIEAAGKKATANKLVYLVDFQTRTNEFYREAAKRVHGGDIGRLVCGEAHYPWTGGNFSVPKNAEDRLRRWYCYLSLSGDHIVEQSIHSIDVASWLLNANPVSATGAGGRKDLRNYGDIWDYFAVIYTFPDNVVVSFNSVQVIPGAPNEIYCRLYGSKGVVDTNYVSHVWIRGKKPYSGGKLPNLFTSGAVSNIKDFYRFVTEGYYANETVAPSVRSNLTAILGRNAAYRRGVLTWEEMMKANERIEPDLKGLKT